MQRALALNFWNCFVIKNAKIAIVCTVLFAAFFLTSTTAIAAQEVYPEKYAAFVMDADTGLILYQKNATKRLHPASLTKVMTLLMLFEAIDNGKLRMNSQIRISEHAASMVPSKLGLQPGSKIRVRDAIYALVTKSANDVAVAVAEKLGGSERNFANMMTKKARSLGMTRTRFINASGLHDKKQISTARDMARLARTVIVDYKRYYKYFSTREFTYQGKTYRSHNRLMDSYPGMDGMKTGYITAAGFNLISSAKINDRRLIGVVFGGKTSKSRNARMKKLLDLGFSKIGQVNIAASVVPVPARKPIDTTQSAKANGVRTISTDVNALIPTTHLTKATNWARWAMLDAMADNSIFNRVAGQGDYDFALRNRVETGLIAIAAHLNEKIPSHALANSSGSALPSITPAIGSDAPEKLYAKPEEGSWSIQVGAFTSRDSTNKALAKSLSLLPNALKDGKAVIAPKQTKKGWIYRARIEGYTKAAANEACRLLSDCIVLTPVK